MDNSLLGALEGRAYGNETYKIDYEATVDQIRLLIRNSGSCYQNIAFECFQMPITTRDVYWHDFENKTTYFSNSNLGQCKNVMGECNCRGQMHWEKDQGKITADWLLPMTGLTYKPIQPSSIFHRFYQSTFDPSANR